MANGYNFKVISYKTYMKVVGGGAIRGGGGETGGPGIKDMIYHTFMIFEIFWQLEM